MHPLYLLKLTDNNQSTWLPGFSIFIPSCFQIVQSFWVNSSTWYQGKRFLWPHVCTQQTTNYPACKHVFICVIWIKCNTNVHQSDCAWSHLTYRISTCWGRSSYGSQVVLVVRWSPPGGATACLHAHLPHTWLLPQSRKQAAHQRFITLPRSNSQVFDATCASVQPHMPTVHEHKHDRTGSSRLSIDVCLRLPSFFFHATVTPLFLF